MCLQYRDLTEADSDARQ